MNTEKVVGAVSKASTVLSELEPQIAAARIAIQLGWTTYTVIRNHFKNHISDEQTLNDVLADLDRRIERRTGQRKIDLPSAG